MMPKTSDLRSGADLGHAARHHGAARAWTRWRTVSRPIAVLSYHPLADGIAVEGIRLVKENLTRAYRDGSDLDARAHMMSAALMGATAFQKALGSDPCPVASRRRALRYPPWPDQCGLHAVRARFNRAAIEDKIARLAAYLGLEASFDAFLTWVLALRAEIGVPHTLAGLRVDDRQFDRMSEMAPLDPTAGGNPIPIDARACRRLYENAYLGSL